MSNFTKSDKVLLITDIFKEDFLYLKTGLQGVIHLVHPNKEFVEVNFPEYNNNNIPVLIDVKDLIKLN